MKKFLSILAMALCFVACQNDQSFEASNGDFVNAVIRVTAPDLSTTRAVDDEEGTNSRYGAIKFAEYDAEFWGKYDLRYIFEVRSAEDVLVYNEVQTFDSYQATTLQFRAVPNREYKIYAYADFVNQGSKEDLHYNTSDLSNITVDGMNAMDEAYDAYFASEKFMITTIFNEDITLKRFLSKVRVIATDLEWIDGYADPKTVEVNFYNHEIFQSFNLYKGKVSTAMTNTTYRYDIKKGYYTAGYDSREDHMTLFSTYIYGTPEETAVNFRMDTYDMNDRLIKSNDFCSEIRVRRNCLTTIIGDVLTTSAKINIIVDDNFDKEYIETVEDGEYDSDPVVAKSLATPVVAAEVEGNVVTLTWDAVESAATYSVVVNNEMPVVTNETTYTFTGEYETEYTIVVVAIPEDETLYTPSEPATVTATTEAEPVVEPEPALVEATVSFADLAYRTVYTDDQQVWEQNGIVVTNDKDQSSSNVGNYYNPARFYKNSKITVEAPGNIQKIVVNCVGVADKNAKAWSNSIAGATLSDGIVTIELDGTSNTFVANFTDNQARAYGITVTYRK